MVKNRSARGRTRGMLLSAAALAALAGPASARFTFSDFTGWGSGAAGSSGGTIYPHPNPYQPQTLAPRPEITGNYAIPYLYSPETGQSYADPAYYHAQQALLRWDSMQGQVRWTAPAPSRRSSATRRSSGTASDRRAVRRSSMMSLQEVVDK